MLLNDETPRRPRADLSAARHWANMLYANLHDRAQLTCALDELGILLDGEVGLVRITTSEANAVSEWRRDNKPPQDDELLRESVPQFSSGGQQTPAQRMRDKCCFSVYEMSGANRSLLITYTDGYCEMLLQLRPALPRFSPVDYADCYESVLWYVLPQLVQINQLLIKLKQSIRSRSVTRSLLQLVPLPLAALDSRGQVVACNLAARNMLQRLVGASGPRLPCSMMQPQHCGGLRFDSITQQLICAEISVSSRLLFVEQWGNQKTEIFALQDCRAHPQLNTRVLESIYQLSKAETAVCEWVLAGQEPARIAELQNRSINTIKSQLRSIYRKTGVSNTAQLAQRLFFNPAYWVGRQTDR